MALLKANLARRRRSSLLVERAAFQNAAILVEIAGGSTTRAASKDLQYHVLHLPRHDRRKAAIGDPSTPRTPFRMTAFWMHALPADATHRRGLNRAQNGLEEEPFESGEYVANLEAIMHFLSQGTLTPLQGWPIFREHPERCSRLFPFSPPAPLP